MEIDGVDTFRNLMNLMRMWDDKTMLAREAHFNSANYYERLHYWFGIPVIALTTLVGTGAFTALQESADGQYRILAGIFAVIAAILSGLQTFFNYQGLAEKHRLIANKYSALIREIEMRLFIPLEHTEMMEFIDQWRQKYDSIQVESPSVPERLWRKTIETRNLNMMKQTKKPAQETAA